jgi:hypothetical protein
MNMPGMAPSEVWDISGMLMIIITNLLDEEYQM